MTYKENIRLIDDEDGSYHFCYIDTEGNPTSEKVHMMDAQAWLANTRAGELLTGYNVEYVGNVVCLVPAVKPASEGAMFLHFGGKVYLYTVNSESQEIIMEACATGFKFCRDKHCVDAIKFYANNRKRSFYAYNN